jgi:hypothetical protein
MTPLFQFRIRRARYPTVTQVPFLSKSELYILWNTVFIIIMQRYESLPPQFYLQDIAAINGRISGRELRVNPHQAEADCAVRSWFNQCV